MDQHDPIMKAERQAVYPDGNPKSTIGVQKVDLRLVPPVLIAHTALAMADGARKYGAYNWRDSSVAGSVYLSAALRHIYDYMDGEEFAPDSGAHHLGHAAACLGIILDAMEIGQLIDDRPPRGGAPRFLDFAYRNGLRLEVPFPEEEPKQPLYPLPRRTSDDPSRC